MLYVLYTYNIYLLRFLINIGPIMALVSMHKATNLTLDIKLYAYRPMLLLLRFDNQKRDFYVF